MWLIRKKKKILLQLLSHNLCAHVECVSDRNSPGVITWSCLQSCRDKQPHTLLFTPVDSEKPPIMSLDGDMEEEHVNPDSSAAMLDLFPLKNVCPAFEFWGFEFGEKVLNQVLKS